MRNIKLTDKGLTQINGALHWAADFLGTQGFLKIDDVTIYTRTVHPCFVVVELDACPDVFGEGPTFDEAANDFYNACKTACEDADGPPIDRDAEGLTDGEQAYLDGRGEL